MQSNPASFQELNFVETKIIYTPDASGTMATSSIEYKYNPAQATLMYILFTILFLAIVGMVARLMILRKQKITLK